MKFGVDIHIAQAPWISNPEYLYTDIAKFKRVTDALGIGGPTNPLASHGPHSPLTK